MKIKHNLATSPIGGFVLLCKVHTSFIIGCINMKTIKFREHLAKLVLSGDKTSTWRLFDDKDLSVGDIVDLINWNTKEIFGKAELKQVKEKKMRDLTDEDFDGHERFESDEEMYKHYNIYYGGKVNPDTVVKIIKFDLL